MSAILEFSLNGFIDEMFIVFIKFAESLYFIII